MVDKMYFMAPEFELNFDEDRARKAFKKERAEKDEVAKDSLSKFHGNNIEALYADLEPNAVATAADVEELNALEEEAFKKWYSENKYGYINPKYHFRKVKYDFNKAAKDNSVQARNNLIIDMMWGVLTNKDTTSKIINPGGFDYQKRSIRIVSILESSSLADIDATLKSAGIDLGLTQINDKVSATRKLLNYLIKADLTTLDNLANTSKKPISPLSPLTQVYFHQQNMTGASMIGIYANHNANHAILQHTDVQVNSEFSFMFNNKTLTSLHEIKNQEGEYISKNNAGYLAASVDNTKDPVLSGLNQNAFTADTTMLLSRLGYNPIEIGILLNQPIVKEMTKEYFRNRKNGINQETVVNNVIKRYIDLGGEDVNRNKYSVIAKSYKADLSELAYDIIVAGQGVNEDSTEFYRRQLNVGLLFKHMMDVADTLGKIVKATRYDATKYAAGPTLADTEIKLEAVEDMHKAVTGKRALIISPEGTWADEALMLNLIKYNKSITNPIDRVEALRQEILESPIPLVQAFYTLGIRESQRMLAPYFPQLTRFRTIVKAIRGLTKYDRLDVKTINSIYNDVLVYIMAKTAFFGARHSINPDEDADTIITAEESRDYFINQFPEDFKKIKEANKDIAALGFIDRLDVVVDKDTKIPMLVFKNVGRLTPILRERYMRDWATLLSMENPEAPKLALNLFRYNYYRNGFAFGPSTFIHLAPTMLRLYIPDYVESLRAILNTNDDLEPFIHQYVYNHLDNRKLVPEIPKESTFEFTDEEGNIKDEVTVSVTNSSNEADKKIVKTFPKKQDDRYQFMSFIGTRVNNKWVYYTLVEDDTLADNAAIYHRIEPLGLKYNFLEYEYGVTADEINSVIKVKSDEIDPYSSTSAVHFTEGFDTEYRENPLEDQGYYDTVPDSVLESLGIIKDTSAEDDKNMTSINPNEEYRDANNDLSCK